MDGEDSKPKKKIHVNAASLVDLKAALYHKQQEVRQGGSGAVKVPIQTKKVSNKTASIWRRQPKKILKGHENKSKSSTSTKSSQMTPEEEAELAKSRAALEAKAKLYDKLSKGEGLLNSDNEDDEDGEDGPKYMVDFQRKIYEETHMKNGTRTTEEPVIEVKETMEEDEPAANSDEEWVEYTDFLGRSRRCMKKDLEGMKKIDNEMYRQKASERKQTSRSPSPDLLSEDMRRERERIRWEKEAMAGIEGEDDEVEKPAEPVHYQTVQHNEVRSHGVGYYSFSMEEEKRQEQLKMLNKLRDDTIDQRSKREKLKEKRQAIMEAKLARVRERKLKQGRGENDKLLMDIAGFDFEQEKPVEKKDDSASLSFEESLAEVIDKAREKAEEEEREKHVRPWDKGKIMDPIRKRKKELQNERPQEFAPPTFYYNKKSKEQSDVFSTNPTPQTETQSDSNSTSRVPSFSFPPPPPFMFYPPPIYPYPTPFMYPPPPPPPPSQVPPPSSSITPNSSS